MTNQTRSRPGGIFIRNNSNWAYKNAFTLPPLSILTNSGADNRQECSWGEEALEMNIYVECWHLPGAAWPAYILSQSSGWHWLCKHGDGKFMIIRVGLTPPDTCSVNIVTKLSHLTSTHQQNCLFSLRRFTLKSFLCFNLRWERLRDRTEQQSVAGSHQI